MKLWQILIITTFMAVVALAGCVNTASLTPTPTTVPANPSQTPLPTPETVTIGTEHGTQVRQSNAMVTLAETANPNLQAENCSLTFENLGDAPVNNVGFGFHEKDLRTGQELFREVYLIGTIPANSNVTYNLTTTPHKESFSVITDIDIYWGEKVEYKKTYQKSFTLAGLSSAY